MKPCGKKKAKSIGGINVNKPNVLRPASKLTRFNRSSKVSNKPNATPKNEVIKAAAENTRTVIPIHALPVTSCAASAKPFNVGSLSNNAKNCV